MKIMYKTLVSVFLMMLLSISISAQNTFVVNVIDFEVIGKDEKSNQLIDTFHANAITTLSNFEKIFNDGMQQKLIRTYPKKTVAVSSEKTLILASEGRIDLVDSKKIKIGEVPKFDFQITPFLLNEDSKTPILRLDILFERNEIPAGDHFSSVDKRSYKTSISNTFDQANILSAGRTIKGNTHFLVFCFSRQTKLSK